MTQEDTDLVRRSIRGEQDAFEDLVRKYQDAVYGLAFHMTGDFADAQDVAQQTFVTAYLRLSQLKDPSKFVSWLNKITVNESVSWLRKRQRVAQLQGQMMYANGPTPTPHQECEERELEATVRKALESLSEKNRLAVTLYYIDGLSQREVAGFLGTSTSAVENRISRARKQLREEMMDMVEDTLKNNSLPDDFIQKIRESLDKSETARKEGHPEEALNYSDEALDALARIPESSEAKELRKKALWLKGDIVYFPLGSEEKLKYHEQAFELEEKAGDKRNYAGALLRLSSSYFDVSQEEKAVQYRQEALKIYEEIGDLAGQAEIWMWRGSHAFVTEPENALSYFQKALALYNQMEDKILGYESVCRAAVSLLKEVGISPGTGELIDYHAVSEVVEKTSDRLAHVSQPGFGTSRRRTGYEWEKGFSPSIVYSICDGKTILDYGMAVGDSWTTEAFSFTFKPLKATRVVESDSETVSVIAGTFENCLKLKTVITPDPDDDGRERQIELNKIHCGTKEAWFAPGVGPVKFIFDRADGVHVHIELAEYSVKDGNGDYFPLSVGNRWVHRWCGADERYVTKSSHEVAVQEGDRYYIDDYAYAYFSGSQEEYDALAQ